MIVAGFLLTGCAEQTQTTSVNPDGGTRIAPLSAAEVRRARSALAELPDPPKGWVNAVVIEEHDKGCCPWWRVIADAGVLVLEEAYSDANLGALLAPGDAIRYSTEGDDLRVSAKDEVVVLDLAVTEAGQ